MLIAALRKELLLQWRSRAQFMAVFVFGAAALLLFSFAVGPVAEMLRQFSAGFLWLGLLLSSTLTLAESFKDPSHFAIRYRVAAWHCSSRAGRHSARSRCIKKVLHRIPGNAARILRKK